MESRGYFGRVDEKWEWKWRGEGRRPWGKIYEENKGTETEQKKEQR